MTSAVLPMTPLVLPMSPVQPSLLLNAQGPAIRPRNRSQPKTDSELDRLSKTEESKQARDEDGDSDDEDEFPLRKRKRFPVLNNNDADGAGKEEPRLRSGTKRLKRLRRLKRVVDEYDEDAEDPKETFVTVRVFDVEDVLIVPLEDGLVHPCRFLSYIDDAGQSARIAWFYSYVDLVNADIEIPSSIPSHSYVPSDQEQTIETKHLQFVDISTLTLDKEFFFSDADNSLIRLSDMVSLHGVEIANRWVTHAITWAELLATKGQWEDPFTQLVFGWLQNSMRMGGTQHHASGDRLEILPYKTDPRGLLPVGLLEAKLIKIPHRQRHQATCGACGLDRFMSRKLSFVSGTASCTTLNLGCECGRRILNLIAMRDCLVSIKSAVDKGSNSSMAGQIQTQIEKLQQIPTI